MKTKWQELMDKPKGAKVFNPKESFALQIYWVVRSLPAAAEMIAKGLIPCAKATNRDTPTTLTYLFRIAQDQSLATELAQEVQTIAQHPHYRSAFKSLHMGLPRHTIDMKLSHGGIDLKPLDWDENEAIDSHRDELDFHPVVLECTEVYLDSRSFYDHSCSRDWMQSYPEIMKANRSLRPYSYCIGNPREDVWSQALESHLQATLVPPNEDHLGLFVSFPFADFADEAPPVWRCFIELDIYVGNDDLASTTMLWREFQTAVRGPYLVAMPGQKALLATPEESPNGQSGGAWIRYMMPFSYHADMSLSSFRDALMQLRRPAWSEYYGRLLVFAGDEEGGGEGDRMATMRNFLPFIGLDTDKVVIVDAEEERQHHRLAGYVVHQCLSELETDDTVEYRP